MSTRRLPRWAEIRPPLGSLDPVERRLARDVVAAAGERGVDRACRILHDETVRTLQLLGVPKLDDVGRNTSV